MKRSTGAGRDTRVLAIIRTLFLYAGLLSTVLLSSPLGAGAVPDQPASVAARGIEHRRHSPSLQGGGALNHPPTATPDEVSTLEERPVTIDVLANDSDPDSLDRLLYVDAVGSSLHGAAAIQDNQVLYTPALHFRGSDVFTYTVSDRRPLHPLSATGAVTVTVIPVNHPPAADDDSYVTAEDAPLRVDGASGVLINDGDPDGDPLTAVLLSAPFDGALTLSPDGAFVYTPTARFNGVDAFTYRAGDGQALSSPAVVTLSVTPVNYAPVAGPDEYRGYEDAVLIADAVDGVLHNDSDADGDPLTAVLAGAPLSGTVDLAPDGGLVYTPAPGFNGVVTFTYQADDGQAQSHPIPVTITVAAANDPPVSRADEYSIAEDTSLRVDAPGVLANDSDPDGDPLTAVLFEPSQGGAVSLALAGGFVYTPTRDLTGSATFIYRAYDGQTYSDFTVVTVTVDPVNDAPVARNDAYDTPQDTLQVIDAPGVLRNDSDVDGDPLAARWVGGPRHGTLALAPDGGFVYTPTAHFAGADVFTYEVRDPGSLTGTAAVAITLSAVNHRPQPVDDQVTTPEDTPVTIPVLANDTDPEDGSVSILVAVGRPGHGTAASTTSAVRYDPQRYFNGTDVFTYTVEDSGGLRNSARITVTVTPVNYPPQAGSMYVDALWGFATPMRVLSNCYDVDGDPLVVVSIGAPGHGRVATDGAVITYTSDPTYYGPDSFDYTISDGHATARGGVGLRIYPGCDMACADSAVTTENTPVVIDVLRNEEYPNRRVSISKVSKPAHGVATPFDSSIKYTPDPGFTGFDTFTYTTKACNGRTGSAAVGVHINPSTRPPVAFDDFAEVSAGSLVSIPVLQNDVDPDRHPLVVAALGLPARGQATTDGTAVTYVATTGVTGTDSFTYTVSDGRLSAVGSIDVTVGDVDGKRPPAGNSFAAYSHERLNSDVAGLFANDRFLVVHTADGDRDGIVTFAEPGGEPVWQLSLEYMASRNPQITLFGDRVAFVGRTSPNGPFGVHVLDAGTGAELLLAINEGQWGRVGDRYLVTHSGKIIDLAQARITFEGETPGRALEVQAIVGDHVLYWDRDRNAPLLVSAPDLAESWADLSFPSDVNRVLRDTSIHYLAPGAGFPVLLAGAERHAANGQQPLFYFLNEAGTGRWFTPDDLGLPGPYPALVDVEFALTRSGPDGPLLVACLSSRWTAPAKRPAHRIVVLNNQGHLLSGVDLPVTPTPVVEGLLDAQGNLLLLSGDWYATSYVLSSYTLPGLQSRYAQRIPMTQVCPAGALLERDQVFFWGSTNIARYVVYAIRTSDGSLSAFYPFDARGQELLDVREGELGSASGMIMGSFSHARHRNYNSTHLFLPVKDASGTSIGRIPFDAGGWLPETAGLTVPSPVYTGSSVQVEYTPAYATLTASGGDIASGTWRTPDQPGIYTLTLSIGTAQLQSPVEVLDIALITDSDADGLLDPDEALAGTRPDVPDTDDDGALDGLDLSPLIRPAPPEWHELQKPGMVRLAQPIRARGIDGKVEVWDVHRTSKHLVNTYPSGATMDSDLRPENVKRSFVTPAADLGYAVDDAEPMSPHDIAADACLEFDQSRHFDFDYLVGGSWPLKQTEYRFHWDELARFYRLYLRNTRELRFPSEQDFYRYLLYPTRIQPGLDQSLTVQFEDASLQGQMQYTNTQRFRMPFVLYSYYRSDNFAAADNAPYHQGLAAIMPEPDDLYSFTLQLPKEKATDTAGVLQITPVWVEQNGGEDPAFTPLVPSMAFTGLRREYVLLQNPAGRTQILSEELSDFAELSSAAADPAEFRVAEGQTPPAGLQTRQVEFLLMTPDTEEADSGFWRVVSVTRKVATIVAGKAVGGASVGLKTKSLIDEVRPKTFRTKDPAKVPDGGKPQGLAFKKTLAGLKALKGILSVVSDGKQVVAAVQDGDTVKLVYYGARTSVGSMTTATTLAESAVTTFKWFGKESRMAKFGKLSKSRGLAVAELALNAGLVIYDFNRYNKASDPFMKNYYWQATMSDAVDMYVAIPAAFVPELLVFTLTWALLLEAYGLFFGEDLAYTVASHGFGLPFLAKYWTNQVDMDLAMQAHKSAAGKMQDSVAQENEGYGYERGDHRWLAVLIGPAP